MNDLEAYFQANNRRLIHKWMHYFELYERHFARFRGQPVTILEFGVSQGGSLQMWRDYFGPAARLFGVDINPQCRQFEEEGVRIFIGDQADRSFLRALAQELPQVDILIDDGGHTMKQQIATFEELFPRVAPDGVYLCEDVHTSYWRRWGGGYRKRGTFIEYSKGWIDDLNAWHSRQPRRLRVSDFTRTAHSVHFYDSVVVVEKRPVQPPTDVRTGRALFPDWVAPPSGPLEWLQRRIKAARGR
jgi:hypothetical protein